MMPRSVYAPAPWKYRVAHWLRFFFRRGVVSLEPPENLGYGLRQVVTLDCGHVFHRKPKRTSCAACAVAWLKRRKK